VEDLDYACKADLQEGTLLQASGRMRAWYDKRSRFWKQGGEKANMIDRFKDHGLPSRAVKEGYKIQTAFPLLTWS
jgi:hypothetical protein